jgi:hypothetical protein
MALQKDIDGAIIAEVAARLSGEGHEKDRNSAGSTSGSGGTIDIGVSGFSAYTVGFGVSTGPAMAMLQIAAGTFVVCGMTLATVVLLVVRAGCVRSVFYH